MLRFVWTEPVASCLKWVGGDTSVYARHFGYLAVEEAHHGG
jgi:hypothetical protein